MNKKLKGFSLAELLISLLIISIVLSAAIPTITRKAGADRETIWRWTTKGNNAYFGTGSNQTAILGLSSLPFEDQESVTISSLLVDEMINDNASDDPTGAADGTKRAEIGAINPNNLKFSSFGDKFLILKKKVQGDNSNFMNSHISFYTMPNTTATTTADIKYSGRLSLDPSNIALGSASLQNINADNIGENTALGHFGLMRTTSGYRNTAVGKKTLSHNESGSYNTALGYGALFQMGRTAIAETAGYSENTAVGSLSQLQKATGRFNTSVGSQSLKRNTSGDSNTVVGRLALANLINGSNNTVVGDKACSYVTSGSNNICIGKSVGITNGTTVDNYGVFIGTMTADDVTPLISGHSTRVGTDYNNPTAHKELIVNARNVEFRPFNGIRPTFVFNSFYGADKNGYDNTVGKGIWGTAQFNLRDTGGDSSVSVAFGALGTSNNDKEFRINAYNPYNSTGTAANADWAAITFNNMLKLKFPTASSTGTFSNGAIGISTPDHPIAINESMKIYSESSNTKIELPSGGEFSIKAGSSSDSGMYITSDSFGISNSGSISIMNGSNSIWIDGSGISQTSDTNYTITAEDFFVESENIKLGNIYVSDDDISVPEVGRLGQAIKDIRDALRSQSSDERKKNVLSDSTAGLEEINKLEVKNYTYKEDKENKPHVGVIAQQLQKVFPNSVFKDKDGFFRITTEEIFYAMVNSIKQLSAKLQDLVAKVTGLERRIEELEYQNNQLREQNRDFERRIERLEQKQWQAELR